MVSLPSVAVVGAGVAGVCCAAQLRDAGFPVQIFDKSRGVGGRLATRRWPSGLAFDHGAPSFAVEDTALRAELEAAGDTAACWQPAPGTEADAADWVGTPRMNAWLKPRLGELAPQLNTPINRVSRSTVGWSLAIEKRTKTVSADLVVLATPAPQAAVLAAEVDELASTLAAVRFTPCWAVLLALSTPAPTPHAVITDLPAGGSLAWLGRNSSKPGRDPDNPGWVAHAAGDWSTEHLELSTEAAVAALLPAITDILGVTRDQVSRAQAHRWRYAQVAEAAGIPYLASDDNTLFAVGDGCLGGGVDGAYRSARALATALIEHHAI